MKSKDQHQGKFHLASIFLIPGFIVTLFLNDSWLYSILYCVISILLLYLLFRKKYLITSWINVYIMFDFN